MDRRARRRRARAAYERVGLTEDDLRTGYRYIRLNQLKRLLDEGELDHGLHWTGTERVAPPER